MKVRKINSLGEYYQEITEIGKEIAAAETIGTTKVPPLWFRAESDSRYTLLSGLFRNSDDYVNIPPGGAEYSNMHYAEEVRMQHFIAKNYHSVAQKPSSRIEWLEVMQHYEVRTRVLDWSESSTHSLLFAMEPFFSGKQKNRKKDTFPCVWVLDPRGLNRDLIANLAKNDSLLNRLMERVESSYDIAELKKWIEDLAIASKNLIENSNLYHLDYIVNLSRICDELQNHRLDIGRLMKGKEAYNPVYYLLARIYAEGVILDDYSLPPLAVVHPYHSERIRTQRGVFTVMPFYKNLLGEQRKKLNEIGLNPDSMSFNEIARKHLYKLVFPCPQEITYEILANGMNDSWLYPEIPIVSDQIENHKIY